MSWRSISGEPDVLRRAQTKALEIMAPGQPVRAIDIAAAAGCSKRTIYRAIEALRDQGHRIPGGAGFGYVLRPPRRDIREVA
jgi:predicted DNA-binding transcriptional regulator YafY